MKAPALTLPDRQAPHTPWWYAAHALASSAATADTDRQARECRGPVRRCHARPSTQATARSPRYGRLLRCIRSRVGRNSCKLAACRLSGLCGLWLAVVGNGCASGSSPPGKTPTYAINASRLGRCTSTDGSWKWPRLNPSSGDCWHEAQCGRVEVRLECNEGYCSCRIAQPGVEGIEEQRNFPLKEACGPADAHHLSELMGTHCYVRFQPPLHGWGMQALRCALTARIETSESASQLGP